MGGAVTTAAVHRGSNSDSEHDVPTLRKPTFIISFCFCCNKYICFFIL